RETAPSAAARAESTQRPPQGQSRKCPAGLLQARQIDRGLAQRVYVTRGLGEHVDARRGVELAPADAPVAAAAELVEARAGDRLADPLARVELHVLALVHLTAEELALP